MLKKITVLCALFLIVTSIVFAQDGGNLEPDTPVQGEIAAPGERDTYFYEGLNGERITITLNAIPGSSLDTALELYDSLGTLLVINDDADPASGNTNSAVTFTLPYNDTFKIVARGFAQSSIGGYEILLTVVTASPNAPPTGNPIVLDQPVNDQLEVGNFDIWSFTPETDMNIQISMTSTEIDALLEVYDSRSVFITSDDDGGEETNALIFSMAASAGETYQIYARTYNDASGGAYTLTVTPAPPPPPEQTIQYGDTVESRVYPGQTATFTFEGQANDVITVSTTGDFDAHLELRDSSGTVIEEDDDSGEGFMPMLENITLPATDTYQLVVGGYENQSSGTFTLTLSEGQMTVTTNEALNPGETVTGFLPVGENATYSFSGSAGDAVSVTIEANFDSVLELYDAQNVLLLMDDDSGGDFNPAIENYILPDAGDYVLVLRGFSPDVSGSYSLTFNIGGASSGVTPEAQPIAYGETLQGNLEANQQTAYTFEGTAGDVITASVQSNFDAQLELRDENNRLVTSDDDSGGELQPLIENFELPQAGTYTLVVYGYSNFDTGSFSVTLLEGSSETPTASGATIAYGDTITTDLVPGVESTFVFTAQTGDVITISATAEFDGYLDLYDNQGTLIASDDDSGEGFNPLLENVAIPSDGDYQILFSSFGGQGRGSFTLTLSAGESATPVPQPSVQAITIGTRINAALTPGSAQQFTFEAQANDQITLSAAPVPPTASLDLYLEIYAPDGTLLAADDDSGWRFNPVLIGITLPAYGTYTVEVRSFDGTASGDFLLAFEAGSVVLSPSGNPSQPLPLDTEISTELTPADTLLYEWAAVSGDALTISSSSAFEIYSAIDDFMPADDTFTAPADGTYWIVVYSETGGTFSFTATLSSTAAVEPFTTTAGALLADEPGNGALQDGETQQWTFTPARSGNYSILLSAGDPTTTYDPYVRVLRGDGTIIGEDDDSGANFDALVANIALTGGETITIEATSFAAQVGGTYTLTVITESLEEVAPVDAGKLSLDTANTQTINTPSQQVNFTLEVENAGTFTFSIEGLTLPYIDLYDEAGELVARGSTRIDAQKLEAGTYQVVIYDRLNRTGEFTLTVTSAEE